MMDVHTMTDEQLDAWVASLSVGFRELARDLVRSLRGMSATERDALTERVFAAVVRQRGPVEADYFLRTVRQQLRRT